MLRKSLVLASAIILASCCAVPEQAKLPLPPPLVLPTVEASELQCLSDETYEKLVERDVMCTGRVHTLENIIKQTH